MEYAGTYINYMYITVDKQLSENGRTEGQRRIFYPMTKKRSTGRRNVFSSNCYSLCMQKRTLFIKVVCAFIVVKFREKIGSLNENYSGFTNI
jgi:hypothetical protein